MLSGSKATLDQDRWRAHTQHCRRPESAPIRGLGRTIRTHQMQKRDNSVQYAVQTLTFHTGSGEPSHTVSRHPMKAYYDAARQRHNALRTISSPVFFTSDNPGCATASCSSAYGAPPPSPVGLRSRRSLRPAFESRASCQLLPKHRCVASAASSWSGSALPVQRPRRIRAARVDEHTEDYHEKKPAAAAEPQRLRAAQSAPELHYRYSGPNTTPNRDRLDNELFLSYIAEKHKLRQQT